MLSALRALLPNRPLVLHEALRIAELQADRLRQLRGYADTPVSFDILVGLPRLIIEHDDELPRHAASGVSYWDGKRRSWVLALNPEEPVARQLFSTLHEYKHVLDHGSLPLVGDRPADHFEDSPGVRKVADYFAGCVLMPKRMLIDAFCNDGIQRTGQLAEIFGVSRRAIEVRLAQLGLGEPVDNSTGRPHYRVQRPGQWNLAVTAGAPR